MANCLALICLWWVMSQKQKKKQNKKNKKSNILIYAIAILMLLAGLCVFLYPVVSNYLQEKNHTEAISVYNDTVEKKTEAELSAEWEKAKIYNENLAGDPVHDPFVPGSGYTLPDNYNSILNLNNDGMMGYIEIPSISVNLPIYHSTTEEVLEKGVGHIESTSLPIGGSGTHCVLTGHTGLPSAELFTRLSELEKGDVFYISVLDKTLAYKVCEINVVLPNDMDKLVAYKGRDLITLVTCTPYGVNSHRLLVTAERTEYTPEQEKSEAKKTATLFGGKYHYYIIGICIALPLLLLLLIIYLIYKKRKRKKEEKKDASNEK